MAQTRASQQTRHPLAAFHFRVTVGSTPMSFTEVAGLTWQAETVTYRHGLSFWEGESITRFVRARYVPVTLKRGVVQGQNDLYKWSRSGEPRPVHISLCDERGNPVLTWHLARALLVKIEAPSLQAGSNDAAIESLELMAAGITIQSA